MKPYYDEDGITVYHDDCRVVLSALDLPDSDQVFVLTDPPYGINLSADYEASYGPNLWSAARRIDHAPVHGDTEQFDPRPLMLLAERWLLFGANYYRTRLPDDVGGWLVWDKVCGNDVRRLPGWSDGEMAYTNAFRGLRIYRHAWNGFSRSSENSFHVHPTQKPVVLMRWLLDKFVPADVLVLDPYMGSGPLARACLDTGRRYVGIEIEEQYCEVAVSRLGQGVLDLNAQPGPLGVEDIHVQGGLL